MPMTYFLRQFLFTFNAWTDFTIGAPHSLNKHVDYVIEIETNTLISVDMYCEVDVSENGECVCLNLCRLIIRGIWMAVESIESIFKPIFVSQNNLAFNL